VLDVAPFLAPPFLAAPFLDFLVAGCFEVPASPFFFLHDSNIIRTLCKANAREKWTARTSTHFDFPANEGGNSTPSSVGGSKHPFSICPNCKHLLHWYCPLFPGSPLALILFTLGLPAALSSFGPENLALDQIFCVLIANKELLPDSFQ